MKPICTVILFFIMACNSGSNTVSPNITNDYFFECTIDGKRLRAECCEQPQNVTGYLLEGEANTQITGVATAQFCNTPGSHCFGWSTVLLGQQPGVYTAYTFAIQINQGADVIYYTAHNFNPPKGNVTVTISEINRSANKLKGAFTGTVIKNVNGTATETALPVSGNFVLPL